jgi:transcriptional regulator with XRE-family HTH domain
MPKDSQLRITLRRWFSTQSKYKSLREMATASAIPFNTLRGYFSGKRPTEKNLQRLAESTGLELSFSAPSIQPITDIAEPHDEKKKIYAAQLLGDLHYDLSRCLSSLLPAQKVLAAGKRETATSLRKKAQSVQIIMDALERNLESFLDEPEALRILRQTVSGSDAAYISGILGAMFDDRRLQTWKELTTYKYGSK